MASDLPRMLNSKELRLLVPFTSQHISRLEKKNQFPKRIKIGERRVGWWQHEVMEWLEHRART